MPVADGKRLSSWQVFSVLAAPTAVQGGSWEPDAVQLGRLRRSRALSHWIQFKNKRKQTPFLKAEAVELL